MFVSDVPSLFGYYVRWGSRGRGALCALTTFTPHLGPTVRIIALFTLFSVFSFFLFLFFLSFFYYPANMRLHPLISLRLPLSGFNLLFHLCMSWWLSLSTWWMCFVSTWLSWFMSTFSTFLTPFTPTLFSYLSYVPPPPLPLFPLARQALGHVGTTRILTRELRRVPTPLLPYHC